MFNRLHKNGDGFQNNKSKHQNKTIYDAKRTDFLASQVKSLAIFIQPFYNP